MYILSSFNSDYLHAPLDFLLKKLTSESVFIKYVNTNLIGELLHLKTNSEEQKSFAVLFRLSDFIDLNLRVDETKFIEYLDLIVRQIISIKHDKNVPFLVFMCPSPRHFYTSSPLKNIENLFLDKLKENKIHALTLSAIEGYYGNFQTENSIEEDTHIPYTPEFYTAMACLLTRKLHAIKQKQYKVIVVDCDYTLWEGAAADIGPEKVEFKQHNIFLQEYLVKQQEQGCIICLCSKNNEQTVLDVLMQRSKDMILKSNHIFKVIANFRLKSENILNFITQLNVGADTVLFIDDNPIEINEVSKIAGITCERFSQEVDDLKANWIFDLDEYSTLTETDKNRTEFYKQAQNKAALEITFNDPVEYLKSPELNQSIVIRRVDSKNDVKAIQRVSQLSSRTNQFNLFPELNEKKINELTDMIGDDNKEIFIGTIKDAFSPEDITAVAITSLNKSSLTITSFFVSCRSFGRGIEFEMLKTLALYAKEKNLKNIDFKFKKSKKNNSVGSFLTILSKETNKNPIAAFLLTTVRNFSWAHNGLKILLKKSDICVDFNAIELDEEFVLTLSTRKLIDLDLDTLLRLSINISQGSTKEQANKKNIPSSNEISKKYLIELNEMTASLDYLLKKFFVDDKVISAIAQLGMRVITVCNQLLGEQAQNDSLVGRGLDSLKATQLRYHLYESEGIIITIPQLLCQQTTVNSLIEYIKEQKKSPEKITQGDNFYNLHLPVSHQQQRIWFAEQKECANNSTNYHMTICYNAGKSLHSEQFEIACKELIKLYDVFGTTFFMLDNELKQSILPPEARQLHFQRKDLAKASCLEVAIQAEINQAWTMSDAPLIRFTLFKEQIEENHYILFHVHHAIFDAVSLKNCLETLSILYQSSSLSNSSELIEYPPQYIKFIEDQQKKLTDEAYQAEALNFWKKTLSRIETVTVLPCDLSLSTFKPATELMAKRYRFSLSSPDLSALKVLAKSTGVTCFAMVSALFSLLVGAYTFQKNITLVTATNGRSGHPSFDKMVGFFVNLLVQQVDLEKNQRFIDYLKQVNEKILASQVFQDIPFNKIQEILLTQNVKDILLSPAFIYQSYAIPTLELGNEKTKLVIPQEPIIFDLRKTCRFGHFTLFAQENQQELSFVIEYAEDLFSASFIAGFAKNFLYTIRNANNNVDQCLEEISVVCDEERSQLMSVSQGPKLDYAENDNLIQKFKLNVQHYPDHTALCYGEISLSYKEVDQQSTNLACALIKMRVKQGDYVGLFLDANHLFFIAELAILKIGAIFIPLSKEDPYDRLQSIIEDANIKFFIVDNTRKGLFDTDFKASQLIPIHLAQHQSAMNNLSQLTTTMEDSACILYTSGSTGSPKGVVLSQKAIFRVIISLPYSVQPQDKIAQTANQVFDAAQLEFFLAFLNGASLVIVDKNVLLNEKLFTKKVLDNNMSIMWLTAGLFNLYALKSPEIFMKLKFLMSGGDVVDKKAMEQVLSINPSLQLMNGYGPTETGIFALTYLVNRENLKKFSTVPIGRPTIAGTQVFILNAFNGLAPLGAIGQLGISGDGLGDYHHNDALQKKCFLPYPKNLMIDSSLDEIKLRARIYMSGDKVQLKYNEISFLGRMNEEQIKIRGNLVSLAEIKNALEKYSAIKQAEILYKEINKNKALVVFYTKNEGSLTPNKDDLIQFLRTKLSSAMIPIYYEKIKQFQLTANGKLDRAALSVLPLTLCEEKDSDKENSSENVKKIQDKLLSIFAEILPCAPTLHDSFFNMGGNSIEAVQLIAKIEARLGKIISFDILRQNSSVRALSHLLERDECLENNLLSLLNKGTNNKRPPIVFIHPAGGGLFCFNKLIDALKDVNLPNYCYGIEDPIILERKVKKLTIPEMATSYLKYIREKIKGPFILAGYSFGGMIALEIAAQLEALNQPSLGVILIDTWVVSCADEALKAALRSHVLEYCEEVIQNVNAKSRVDGVDNLIMAMMSQCIYYQQIGFEFEPKKLFSTSVSLFKAKDTDKFKGMEEKTQCNYLEKFVESKNLVKHSVEGNHFNLLEESTNLAFLGKKIANYVEKKYHNMAYASIKPTTFFLMNESNSNLKNTIVSKQTVDLRH